MYVDNKGYLATHLNGKIQHSPTFDEACSHPAIKNVIDERDELKAHAEALAEDLRGLFEHCAMVHKHWGDGSNQAEADAAIDKAKADLAAYEKGAR